MNKELKSLRQDQLPQEALDLSSWAFASLKRLADGELDPLVAIEVRLDDPVKHILYGGDGLICHSRKSLMERTSVEKLFSKEDDPDWAVVCSHDCLGDAADGLKAVKKYGWN